MKIGELVFLKSGGPAMTVTEIFASTNTVACAWFDAGTIRGATIHVDALTGDDPHPVLTQAVVDASAKAMPLADGKQ